VCACHGSYLSPSCKPDGSPHNQPWSTAPFFGHELPERVLNPCVS
jgi:hypothetical protein